MAKINLEDIESKPLSPLESILAPKKVKKKLEKMKVEGVNYKDASLSFSDWVNILLSGVGEYFKQRSGLTDQVKQGNIIIEILKVIIKILSGKL